MFSFDFCFPKAAEAVGSRQLQNDRLTVQRINRVCRFYDFCEIWSEHALIDKEQKTAANSFILNTFLVAASNTTRYAVFSIVQLDRSIKR